ncbi:MAG: hypothetical protein HQRvContig03_10 [Haloquadratum phage sp.]|nr:MAG: hypothetical protein HQRvContig03_10 [Haloquadratum phage sp.]
MSENSHAGSVLAQLRQAEADDDLPDELAERLDDTEGDDE